MEFIESGSSESTIVLFHGYGADMHDLASLAEAVPNGELYRWVFPNGIKKVEIAPQYFGRAWFPINIAEYEKAMREGRARDLSRQRPSGLDKAIEEAEAFVASLQVPDSNLVLGGFSQGAMLAAELAARRKSPVRGVILLSGNLLDEENLKKMASQNPGQRFYQSHGTHDPILDFQQAQRLEDLLTKAGWVGSLDAFRGGHEIPMAVIQNLGHWLGAISPK